MSLLDNDGASSSCESQETMDDSSGQEESGGGSFANTDKIFKSCSSRSVSLVVMVYSINRSPG